MTENKRQQDISAPKRAEIMARPIDGEGGIGSKAATVALVGLGIALIEAELIPGMLIGVAAVLAPDLFPKLGRAMRPLVKSAVRAGYSIMDRTRETVAEAGEQLQDIVAEVKNEATTEHAHAPEANPAPHTT